MKRSPELAPLSRDHHHALAVALPLRRASVDDVDEAVAGFQEFFERHGRRHFEIEEELLLPAGDPDERWRAMAERVRAEHQEMRHAASRLAGESLPPAEAVGVAQELGNLLHDHVRFEERELFELLETLLERSELRDLGQAIERAERS